MSATWWAAIGIAFGGLYTVSSVGQTGGPNHGEHPFTTTIVHMIVFFIYGRHWPLLSRELYWGGLVVALLLSIGALGAVGEQNKRLRIFLRIPLALLYAGFMVILFRKP